MYLLGLWKFVLCWIYFRNLIAFSYKYLFNFVIIFFSVLCLSEHKFIFKLLYFKVYSEIFLEEYRIGISRGYEDNTYFWSVSLSNQVWKFAELVNSNWEYKNWRLINWKINIKLKTIKFRIHVDHFICFD